jgi:hypothetical protein
MDCERERFVIGRGVIIFAYIVKPSVLRRNTPTLAAWPHGHALHYVPRGTFNVKSAMDAGQKRTAKRPLTRMRWELFCQRTSIAPAFRWHVHYPEPKPLCRPGPPSTMQPACQRRKSNEINNLRLAWQLPGCQDCHYLPWIVQLLPCVSLFGHLFKDRANYCLGVIHHYYTTTVGRCPLQSGCQSRPVYARLAECALNGRAGRIANANESDSHLGARREQTPGSSSLALGPIRA